MVKSLLLEAIVCMIMGFVSRLLTEATPDSTLNSASTRAGWAQALTIRQATTEPDHTVVTASIRKEPKLLPKDWRGPFSRRARG